MVRAIMCVSISMLTTRRVAACSMMVVWQMGGRVAHIYTNEMLEIDGDAVGD